MERHRAATLRVVGLCAAFVAASLAARGAAYAGLGFLEGSARGALTAVLACAAVAALTAWALRRRPAATDPALALLPRGAGTYGLGLAIGTLLLLVAASFEEIPGALPLSWPERLAIVGPVLAKTALDAAWEELTFRGWPFIACVREFGRAPTVIATAVLFGSAHMLGPRWSWPGLLSVTLAGLLLGAAMLAGRGIALPAGIHAGWNFARFATTSPRLRELPAGAGPDVEETAAGITVTAVADLALAAVAAWRQRRADEVAPPEESRGGGA